MSKSRPTPLFMIKLNRAENGWYIEVFGRNDLPRFVVAMTVEEAIEIVGTECRDREKREAKHRS